MPVRKEGLETGSAKLVRHSIHDQPEDNIDVPDGDVDFGRMLYQGMCAGYFLFH